jgi:hypothetical protein
VKPVIDDEVSDFGAPAVIRRGNDSVGTSPGGDNSACVIDTLANPLVVVLRRVTDIAADGREVAIVGVDSEYLVGVSAADGE